MRLFNWLFLLVSTGLSNTNLPICYKLNRDIYANQVSINKSACFVINPVEGLVNLTIELRSAFVGNTDVYLTYCSEFREYYRAHNNGVMELVEDYSLEPLKTACNESVNSSLFVRIETNSNPVTYLIKNNLFQTSTASVRYPETTPPPSPPLTTSSTIEISSNSTVGQDEIFKSFSWMLCIPVICSTLIGCAICTHQTHKTKQRNLHENVDVWSIEMDDNYYNMTSL